MADETPKKDPTPAEAKFFFSIVKNLKAKADIDWDAVAVDQNFKSAEVARVSPTNSLSLVICLSVVCFPG